MSPKKPSGAASPAAAESRRPPLILRTMRRLLRDILTGVYGPGDRIREAEVATRLGISRAPVREALRVLEQDGLVEMLPWRGARVINPTPEDIAASFDLLGAVYGTVARLAVRNASNADLAPFRADVEQFARCVAEGRDNAELVDVAYQAGTDLGKACGSALAAGLLRKLGRMGYWQHRYLQSAPARWRRQSVTRFRKLEEALLARSEERSEQAARRLVQHTRGLLLRHVIEAQQLALGHAQTPHSSKRSRT